MTELIGTNANDTLTGTDENDIIFGRSGDDTLSVGLMRLLLTLITELRVVLPWVSIITSS